MDKNVIRSNHMIKRVANEVEIHSTLKHPSILTLYTYFEDKDNIYLVMELCSHGELFRYLQQRSALSSPNSSPLGPLSEPEARHVMRQMVDGLCYLHAQGILHRDLKLSNLLLDQDDNVVGFFFYLSSFIILDFCRKLQILVWLFN